MAGLTKDNFDLQEDGKDQKIAVFDKESALPLSIALDIDTSLSTRKDLPLELASARRFAQAILRPVDGLSLFGFSEVVDQVVPSPPTSSALTGGSTGCGWGGRRHSMTRSTSVLRRSRHGREGRFWWW